MRYSSAEDVACRTKRQYPSRSQAKQSLKELRRKGRPDLVIYECWFCSCFHLGHPPGKQTYTRPGNPPLNPRPQSTQTNAA